MTERFYVPSPIERPRLWLTGQEAHHLSRVMRARVGDEILLFDGRGTECAARIEQIARGQVELRVGPPRSVDREAARQLTLAVALPKGDRQRWLVEKAVELGVARLIPLVTRRSVARVGDKSRERMQRYVIEASKQSGRTRLMEIGPAASWDELLAGIPRTTQRWLAHPGGRPLGRMLAAGPADVALEVCCAIGPEGGFTPDEIQQAEPAGWQAVDLGRRILRVETAALAVAAVVLLSCESGAA